MNYLLANIGARILNRLFKRLKRRNSALDYHIDVSYKNKEIVIYVRHPDDKIWQRIKNSIPDTILGISVEVIYN